MSDDSVNSAVAAALRCDWEAAKKINEKLLADDPKNVDCLNRLGKALLEMGHKDKAVKIFRKVLRINRYDPIAQKNLDRASLSKNRSPNTKPDHLAVSSQSERLITNFIEEPGKTKLVSLVNLAPNSVLLKRNYGDKISLSPRRHTIIISDQDDCYLGAIPDDLGRRLALLIKAGNQYDGLIKSVNKGSIVIFVRELSRAKRFKNTPSFPTSGSSDYFSFVREETHTDSPKPATTDESETDDDDIVHTHLDDEENEG